MAQGLTLAGDVRHQAATDADGVATPDDGIRDAARLQRRIGELERQLQQSQRLEILGRLAGGVAHDFNNLLTIITGHVELLALAPSLPPDVRDALEQVREAAGRAAQLTGQLLAFSRRSAAESASVDVNRLVRSESSMLRRVVDEDIHIHTHLEDELPEVRCDGGRLAQVLMNLVLNARDAMPSGGTLSVSTGVVTVRQDDARHPGVLQPGEYVLLTVGDTGVGMSEEERARAFEPFFTTKGEGRGTGLGMATVQAIVRESDGYITIASAVGAGTTVLVYLPVGEQQGGVAGVDEEPQEAVGRGETVLLVEDDAAVRAFVDTILTDHGYSVIAAADGAEAFGQLDSALARVDLVVTDVVMPHRSGRAVVAHAQRLNPRVRALYLSGHTEDAIVRQGILRDDVVLLQKPFSPSTLLRAVREVLGP